MHKAGLNSHQYHSSAEHASEGQHSEHHSAASAGSAYEAGSYHGRQSSPPGSLFGDIETQQEDLFNEARVSEPDISGTGSGARHFLLFSYRWYISSASQHQFRA